MAPLTILVAPTGARRTKADHENLPITPDEVAREAAACRSEGAHGIHLHVRDDAGQHVLDAARYLQSMEAIRSAAGSDFIIQITTEAVGKFSPLQQAEVVRRVRPEAVSIAVKEMVPDASSEGPAADFYAWALRERIAVQHIIYSTEELERALDLIDRNVIAGERYSLLFPLGRYAAGQESDPAELVSFLARLRASAIAERTDWWVCAFGWAETSALMAAAALGGHCRVGFENSFFNSDGTRADTNAERVREVVQGVRCLSRPPMDRDAALRALGRPA